MDCNIVIWRDPDGQYVARNLELGVVSQWYTVEEALSHIREATELFIEDCEDLSSNTGFSTRPAFLTSLHKVWQDLAIRD